ncbi:MAG: hypothetical protein HY231_26620 [Acidobacteria bacterium]|nr:hypothetical protein [Acidobacteriota bacterium]
MKKILAFSSMFFVAMVAALSVNAAGSDFSGTWKLDASKSTMPPGAGGGGGGGDVTLEVKQDAKTLTVVRKTARGDQTTTYNLDGSESKSEMTGRMTGTSTHKTKWQGEGKILEINTISKLNMQGQEFEVTAQSHWEVMDGGKTLKIHTTRNSPQGTQESTLLFNKQ